MKVTTKIKEILAAQAKRQVEDASAVVNILEEIKKQIVADLAVIPSESYNAFHMRQSLASIERYLSGFERDMTGIVGKGISDSWESGINLLPSVAETAGITSQFGWISTHTLDALKEFAFGKISQVTSDASAKIKGELTLGVLGQKTPQQVASAIAGNLTGPSIFKSIADRAEVITGLEMGKTFSTATQKSMEQAMDVLPELQSMWLHAGHPGKPRQVHLLMHGQKRAVGKPFYQAQGVPVMFPRDPQAPIAEIIRCGCVHVPWHPEFGSSDDFVKSWDKTQYQLWFKKAA